MVGTLQGHGNHRGRAHADTEDKERDEKREATVFAEPRHHVRYRRIHDRRETERRGCVNQKSLAGLALTGKVSAFFVKEVLLSGFSDTPLFLFIKSLQ